MLSCDCFYDSDVWYYDTSNHFITYKKLQRKKCCSCSKKINFGDICVKFNRYRNARNDIEERIFKGEIPLAPYYMCEQCGEIYLNLSVLGFCLDLERQSMAEALRSYWKLTGFEPIKKEKLCSQ